MSPSQPAFRVADRLTEAVDTVPYQRQTGDPVFRPLRIFALDPAAARRDGALETVRIPYEPEPLGPNGHVFLMDTRDTHSDRLYKLLDLNDPIVLLGSGLSPSPGDALFHQQMTYAVASLVYTSFRSALGRDPSWRFGSADGTSARLLLRPYGGEMRNAYYDRTRGEIVFGYYRADEEVTGRNVPRGLVFTSLSHDVIAHETTHALLDGLRAHFTHPSSEDVIAFHEAFSDLIAIFLHFRHRTLLKQAVKGSCGALRSAKVLNDLAGQFGETTGSGRALRSAIRERSEGTPTYADAPPEPHARGAVLVSAVLEAFFTVYERKVGRYVRIATGSSSVPTKQEPSAALVDVLAEEAEQLARHFLNICIRAIDYCPPVGITFGEYLRAVLTADRDLVPDDPWHYREAWIDAFAMHGIYPDGVNSLDEDALCWDPPAKPGLVVSELSFSRLEFAGDPGRPASKEALLRQADALGTAVTSPQWRQYVGLADPDDAESEGVHPPVVESIRTLRRVGPNDEIVFDVVAEITQKQTIRHADLRFDKIGGSTLIFDPHGELRLVIYKRVKHDRRTEEQIAFMLGAAGRSYWLEDGGELVPDPDVFQQLHVG